MNNIFRSVPLMLVMSYTLKKRIKYNILSVGILLGIGIKIINMKSYTIFIKSIMNVLIINLDYSANAGICLVLV